ncbi:maleylpyruvate isomerase family mycothiol-dependent enzyme [Cumulibacter manganitolerans]|uniref:maleylpyruvate isomerase family mycothiol-dependent enzyme n=1 Tax=Cumulibacter manganitolerans TaxID=1884992 RepID=UPI001295253E|nr:maleylpyruvate isomerase family mycothiol-dependent enzyme [Cumulibacter manganitolerans]
MSNPTRDEIVTGYLDEFAALSALMHDLGDERYAAPSILPGWRVTDVFAHCLGTEYMLLGEKPTVEVDDSRAHLKNQIAVRNEQWVDTMRDDSPERMRERWADVTARRTAVLEGQSQEDFDAESWTPVGKGTLGDFMRIRVYDLWLHELDVRDSIGSPGHEGGPAAEISIAEVERAIGYMVGKRAQAPDGSRVNLELTGQVPRTYGITVAEGRANVGELVDDPTVSLRMTSTDFARLTGNRGDIDAVAARVETSGDVELGRRIARSLGYTM